MATRKYLAGFICLVVWAATVDNSDGQAAACADDPDGVLKRFSLTCSNLVKTGGVSACALDMKKKGWDVAPGTTIADVCPASCNSCLQTGTDLQARLPSEQHFLNVAWKKPVVASSQSQGTSAAAVTDGYAGPQNQWVSAAWHHADSGKTPPQWLIIDLGDQIWVETVNIFAGGKCGNGAEDIDACHLQLLSLCEWSLQVWAGKAVKTLDVVKLATTGWVEATHSHPGRQTDTLDQMNFPPVQTRFVKLIADQSGCAELTTSVHINEIQVRKTPSWPRSWANCSLL
jgi:hypothetical protein